MARLFRESSRPYSGRSVPRARRQRRARRCREVRREGTEVSRGHSSGWNEPGHTPEGLTPREGPNLAGRHDHRGTQAGDEADRLSRAASPRGRERVLLHPSGLPGTAGRGPACPVVWGAGGQCGFRRKVNPPATRLGHLILTMEILNLKSMPGRVRVGQGLRVTPSAQNPRSGR